ncbi:MAG: hypothetical protein ACXW1P_01785 [Methylophilaceae bacterium]
MKDTSMEKDAYGFASEVDLMLTELSNEDYLRKFGRSKKLREELYPLSRLGLHFKLPGLSVEVKAFEDSGRADGYIRINGFIKREFEVQITLAGFGSKDALRAELLAAQGFSPLAGDIQRLPNGEIIATMAAVDYDEYINRIATAIKERFADKAAKFYASGTVLLISFEEVNLSGRNNWELLFKELDKEGGLSDSSFAEVYLFNGATNELRKAF